MGMLQVPAGESLDTAISGESYRQKLDKDDDVLA